MEKLWTKTRAERLIDPTIQAELDAEWVRVKESFGRLGNQTKESTTAIAYNTLVKPIETLTKGDGRTSAKETVKGGVDSGAKLMALIGRVLMTTGRVTKYGIRKALVI